MKTITLKNISKSYQKKIIFEKTSLTISKPDRIAIVGKNGVGKSTLLKIIAGLESFDSGTLIKEQVTCAYISQDFSGDTSVSILEYIALTKATAKVFSLLKEFNVLSDAQVAESLIYQLSGGQKRILEIACVLSRAPMFLCIDEPENHLDIKARSILTSLLKEYWGAVLFVSHDRHIVNAISTKIVSIKDAQVTLTTGMTYEALMLSEQQNLISATDRWKAEVKAIAKLADTVGVMREHTRYSDAIAKTYQMKKRQLGERKQALGERPDRIKTIKLLPGDVQQKTGKLVFECRDVSFSFGDGPSILQQINVALRFGERVVLLGRNGAGKTTFLDLLRQIYLPLKGTVRIGNNLDIRYVHQTTTFALDLTPLEHLNAHGFSEEHARSVLAQFLFSRFESESMLKNLSGGQQQRFTFLFLFKINPECIVLDEPTNNLDPEMWELLLTLINEYTGTMLLISHDRSFVDRITDKKIWILKQKTIEQSWQSLDVILEEL
jgi:ATPase subunit of ABC transporter with duplicated ATPase domains